MPDKRELQRQIETLSRSRATLEERRSFAHKRRKLTLDGLEEERAERVELDRLNREIDVLEARLRANSPIL